MIELVTGLPGNGKTLYTISQVKERAEKENRAVFYHGIPELTLNWEQIDDPKEWAKCPPGSIIVLDEAQKVFRNRSMGSTPPEYVQQLETHRHMGIDIVMITQHPSLIDPAIRRLAGRHQHLVRIWGTEASTVHRWDAVKDNCDKQRSDSEKKKWVFDKRVYGFYKSAEVHTVKRSIPGRVKMLGVLLVLLVCFVTYAARYVAKRASGGNPAAAAVVPGAAAPPGQPAIAGAVLPAAAPGQARAAVDPIADLKEYVWKESPRVAGLPQTAPKYDPLTAPSRVPVPAMCIQKGVASKGDVSCTCFTQQATPMDVPFNMCMQFARAGFFQDFDADKDRQASERSEASAKVLAASPVGNAPERVLDGPRVVADFKETPPPEKYQYRLTGATILSK